MNPRIIVLEGPDGTGKTRHVRALASAIGGAFWHHQTPPAGATDPWAVALHYAALRADLQRLIRRDAYRGFSALVCDRWWLSTQMLGLVLDDDALGSLAEAECRQLGHPDLTVVLTAPDAVLCERLARRGTVETKQDRCLRRAYESHARVSGLPIVDTSGPPEAVTARLVELVRSVA